MRTSALFAQKTVLSLEIFPPRRSDSIHTIYETVDELKKLGPDFISVTYGAGGGDNKAATLEIASTIKNMYGVESVAHLSCIHLEKDEILEMLANFAENGIENILALRGDISPGIESKKDFRYASDLISFIKNNGEFNIIGACYPEGHTECSSIIEDIHNLKRKVDAGTSQLITQVFFDNAYFYSFRERAAIAGIHVPIEAGIMPITNKKQITRMMTLCGATLPRKFLSMMDKYENNPIAMRDAGIAFAIDQIVDLLAQGVDGIHLYTMNNAYIAKRIYEAIYTLLAA